MLVETGKCKRDAGGPVQIHSGFRTLPKLHLVLYTMGAPGQLALDDPATADKGVFILSIPIRYPYAPSNPGAPLGVPGVLYLVVNQLEIPIVIHIPILTC